MGLVDLDGVMEACVFGDFHFFAVWWRVCLWECGLSGVCFAGMLVPGVFWGLFWLLCMYLFVVLFDMLTDDTSGCLVCIRRQRQRFIRDRSSRRLV